MRASRGAMSFTVRKLRRGRWARSSRDKSGRSQVARQCDERFAEMAAEPLGADLVALTEPDLDLRVQTPSPATPAGTPTAGMSRARAADLDPSGLCQLLW